MSADRLTKAPIGKVVDSNATKDLEALLDGWKKGRYVAFAVVAIRPQGGLIHVVSDDNVGSEQMTSAIIAHLYKYREKMAD